MVTQRKKWLSGVVAGLLMAASVTASAEEKTLHVYNWSDYIAPDTRPNSRKKPVSKWCTTSLTPTRCWKAN